MLSQADCGSSAVDSLMLTASSVRLGPTSCAFTRLPAATNRRCDSAASWEPHIPNAGSDASSPSWQRELGQFPTAVAIEDGTTMTPALPAASKSPRPPDYRAGTVLSWTRTSTGRSANLSSGRRCRWSVAACLGSVTRILPTVMPLPPSRRSATGGARSCGCR